MKSLSPKQEQQFKLVVRKAIKEHAQKVRRLHDRDEVYHFCIQVAYDVFEEAFRLGEAIATPCSDGKCHCRTCRAKEAKDAAV